MASMGKGTLYQVVARAVFVLSGYAINASMAYLLVDPVAFGVLGTMINVTNIARVLLATGLPQATSKFIAENDEELAYPILRTSMKLMWGMGAVIVAVYLIGTPLWTRLLNDTSLTPYFIVAAPLIPLLGAFNVLQGYFNGRHRFVAQAVLNMVWSVGRVVFAVALAWAGFAVFGALVGLSLSLVVAIVASLFFVRRTDAKNPESRKLLAFAVPLMVLAIGQAFLVNLDLLMLKRYFPTSEVVGFYAGATALGRTPYFLFTAFSVTLLPLVATALKAGSLSKAGEYVSKNITFLLVALLPVLAVFAAVPGPLLDFVYPASYAAAGPALAWQVAAQSLLAVIATLTSAITAKGRPYVAMAIWLACIPVQIVASILLVPAYSMVGASLGSLVACAFGTVLAGAVTWRYFRALLEPVRVAKAVGASAVVYLLMSLPSQYPLWMLPFACLGGLAVYATIMFLVGGIDRSEIASLLSKR